MEEVLQDKNGNLNVSQICENDAEFLDIIENGWEWTIIPYIVQKIWPQLPDLFQDALNVEQATFSMPSELQVVASLSNRAYHAMATGGNPNWTNIKEEVKATQPPCADYLDTLCDFVALYAGGAGAPVVKFLEGFAKEFAGSR